jgi:hypothetical protein
MRVCSAKIVVATVLTGALIACGKKEEVESTELPPETTLEMEAQFVPATNSNAATIQDRLEGAIHPELTARLHMFVDTYKRMPENFYEFSNRMMDSVPPVPPGMKYEIDPADKSVKVVKK